MAILTPIDPWFDGVDILGVRLEEDTSMFFPSIDCSQARWIISGFAQIG
jgi:hypothetical protein